MARLWKRKFFGMGILIFGIMLFMLSTMVWSIRVEGNEKIASEDILAAARQEGCILFNGYGVWMSRTSSLRGSWPNYPAFHG